jgi:uncharacterized protein (UPF0335 family)
MPDNDNGADEALEQHLENIAAQRKIIHQAEYQIAKAEIEIAEIYLDLKNDGFNVVAVKKMAHMRELMLLAGLKKGEA